MASEFVPAVAPPGEQSEPSWWFAFHNERLLVREADDAADIPYLVDIEELGIAPGRRHYLGRLGGRHTYTIELPSDSALPEGMALQGLRGLYGRLPDDLFALAGRAVQIITWDRTHRFCGQCGTPTEPMQGERARQCPACGLTVYPRISPCVIVLITRGEEMLLARGRTWPEGRYSTPAGFVEPGESLEEAVAREIGEEVGVKVHDTRYFGSQPWPFPHQLMIGFTTSWAEGDIRIDPEELADAKWFTKDNLPSLPPKLSIARRMIDSFTEESSAVSWPIR